MITKKQCIGCKDNIYNYQDFGMNKTEDGDFRCWSATSAILVKAHDIPINQPPPYLGMLLVERPNCYKAKGYCRVTPNALDSKGY